MSDLEERNAKAVMKALNDQNNKLNEFSDRLIHMAKQIQMLYTEVETLKKANMEKLVAKFNSGPTERSDGSLD